MLKTVEINGKKIKLKSSAAIPRMYRKEFNSDVFIDIKHLFNDGLDFDNEAWETVENLAYLFYKYAQGGKEVPEIDKWLEQFEVLDMTKFMPVILEMWEGEQKALSKSKKK